jgi:hypothetical protein
MLLGRLYKLLFFYFFTEENPYKPSYELPSTYREDSSKFRVSEKNKQNDRLSSSQREKITKSDFNQRKEQFTGKKGIKQNIKITVY